MTLRQMVLMGDSLTAGTGPVGQTASSQQGGEGNWSQLVTEYLGNLATVGPVISPGLQMLIRSFAAAGDTQWVKTAGTWPGATTTDAWDKAPYGYSHKAVGGLPKYRVDGGAWINFPTVTLNNSYHRFHVASPIISTLQIANQTESSIATWTKPVFWRPVLEFSIDYVAIPTDTCIVGMTPYFVTSPQTVSQGLIVHNLSANGQRLNNQCASTGGDRFAFFDSVVLDGSAMSHAPNAGVTLMHINDTAINNATTWAANLTTFFNRVHTLGPVIFISPWECSYPTFPQAAQTAYRAQTKTTAATLGAQVIDFYDLWAGNGWIGVQAAQDAGLLVDATHETQDGHVDMSPRIYWHIRQNVLSLGSDDPTKYTVKSKVEPNMLLASDSFNRPDSTTSMGSTDGPGSLGSIPWVMQSGTGGITNNKAYGVGGSDIATLNLGTGDVDLSVQIITFQGGFMFRCTNPSNNWYCYNSTAAGNPTIIGTFIGGTFNNQAMINGAAVGDVLRIIANGSSLEFYRNSNLIYNTTNSFNATTPNHGLWMLGGTFDNWSASRPGVPAFAYKAKNAPVAQLASVPVSV